MNSDVEDELSPLPSEAPTALLTPPPDGSVLFSGIQPTGELHLGNYLGAVKHWATLQTQYSAIFCIVDLHALTVPFVSGEMRGRIFEMALGILACGVDPQRSPLFVQSQVKEHAYLGWILNTLTPMGELERMTQFKDKSEQHRKHVNAGLFTYPVLQAADILLYKARGVPVGIDQVQHIELCRMLARRFNARFGDVFPLPSAMLSPVPKLVGLDGDAKMSKSKNNTILLLDTADAIWSKLKPAKVDIARARRTDAGSPDNCNIGAMHQAFSSEETNAEVREGCTTAGIGCFDCKKKLLTSMTGELAPIQERYQALKRRPADVWEVLAAGASTCRTLASRTMAEVEQRIGLGDRLFFV